MRFVGLDFETTGIDPELHGPIQIGLALEVHDVRGCDIDPGNVPIDPAALQVNGFTEERIRTGVPVHLADRTLVQSLKLFPYGSLTAVGWNVGSFDVAFLRKWFPLSAQYFSHRVVDLTGIAVYKARGQDNWRDVKKSGHDTVELVLGKSQWHDAKFDAAAALLQWYMWLGGI